MLRHGAEHPEGARAVIQGLGSWALVADRGTIKMFASCAAGHCAQDAMLGIGRRRPVRPDQVDRIVVHLPGFLMDSLPFHLPRTGLHAKYSLEYDVVACALDGQARIEQYTDAAVMRPEAQTLMEKVCWRPLDPEREGPVLTATVEVTFTDGEVLTETVTDFHGSAGNPPTRAEIEDKFHEGGVLLTPRQRSEVLERCWGFAELTSVAELMELL
jgi:2-methylcitrate dehydratase PrpD